MSCKELIESLKQAADERMHHIWGDAEAEAAKIRADTESRLELLRQETAAKQKAAFADHVNRAVSDAKNRARGLRLSSEKMFQAGSMKLRRPCFLFSETVLLRRCFNRSPRNFPPVRGRRSAFIPTT